MVEANASLHSRNPSIYIATASHVLAQLRARNAVKAELRKRGVRVADLAAREISSWARVYLDDHPELIAQARPIVEAWIARGMFGKRAQREFRNDRAGVGMASHEAVSQTSAGACRASQRAGAKLTSDAQRANARKSITSAVRNS